MVPLDHKQKYGKSLFQFATFLYKGAFFRGKGGQPVSKEPVRSCPRHAKGWFDCRYARKIILAMSYGQG